MNFNILINVYNSLVLLSNTNVSSTSSWLIFATTIGQLFFLILLFAVIYFFMNKVRNKTNVNYFGNKKIEIVERKYLNNFSSLTLVKVNNKVLLLGLTKEKITVLTEFAEDEMIFDEEVDVNSTKFSEIFNRNFFYKKDDKDRGTYEEKEN